MGYEVTVRVLAPRPTMSIRGRVPIPSIPDAIGEYLTEVWKHLQEQGAQPAGAPYTRYHVVEDDTVEMEAGLPVAASMPASGRITPGVLPGGEAAVTVHAGPYERLPEAGTVLDGWLEQAGRRAAGPGWEVYVTDPGMVDSPDDYRTEVYRPLAPAAR